ncbi:hypothetical protein ACTJJB_05495 [Chitinophaga sp. 22536]|uniref:hypothetical protein n=1 Tax=unclassified Chitinophaga TaxID=2619133 RepID=UPI003F83E489
MRLLFLLLSSIFIISCRPQAPAKSDKHKQPAIDSVFYYMKAEAELFSMPFEPIVADSNELVFFYSNRFDTSMLVHIKKRTKDIYGIVYQVALPYYQMETEINKPISKPQYFEGFSFYVDSSQWESLTKAADSILSIETSYEANMPYDNPRYALAFNSKSRWNINRKDDQMMSEFSTLVKHTFLYDWMSKKPKWTWQKPKER